tara:strand:- start:311 stop:412 length:102 start_codon:yes stop_codon:yes gene_type:complete
MFFEHLSAEWLYFAHEFEVETRALQSKVKATDA